MLLQNFFKTSKNANMLDLFKPLYFLLSILGLFPYNIKVMKHEYVIIEKSIFLNGFFAVVILVTVYIFFFLHILDLYLPEHMNEGLITQLNYALELFIFLLFVSIAYICSYIYRYEHVRILNYVAETLRDLPVDEKRIIKNLHSHIKIVTRVVAFVVFLQIAVNFSRNDPIWKMVLVIFSFNIPQNIQFSLLALYYVFVLMIAASLLNMRDNIEKMGKQKIFNGQQLQLQPYCSINSQITVERIGTNYMKLIKAKKSLNVMFQAPLLFTTILCFHSLVSECHTIYHMVVVSRSYTIHYLTNCSIWAVYQVGKIIALASSGFLLNIRVSQILHSLYSISMQQLDNRSLLQIQHLASLITQQKFDITVYGLFPIDSTLLYNIVAAATMFVIIFVQFDKANRVNIN